MKPIIQRINISFRKAQDNEFDALHALDKNSDSIFFWRRSFFTNSTILLAISNEEIIGFVVYQKTDVIEILRIVTKVNFYQKGVASGLISELKKYKLELFLELRASNHKAYQLYKKCGFEQINIRKKYYKNSEDAKIMRFYSRKIL
jgi:ribosomal-protein-alanine N-acetyltransferase